MRTKPIKKNKTKINCLHRPLMKKDYFSGISPADIAEKYGYTLNTITKFVKSSATKNYIEDGVKLRRCSICGVGRPYNMYGRNYNYFNADCRICRSLMRRNNNQILINIGKKEDELIKRRKSWAKHKWKYNIKRRILRIIN